MKIHFELIGREHKTFDVQIDDGLISWCGLNPKSVNRYGDRRILAALCDDYRFLPKRAAEYAEYLGQELAEFYAEREET